MKPTLVLVAFFVAAFSAAFVGARFPPGGWYAGLAKPAWTPPNWLFGPVWTALYAMIAVSGWLVWRRAGFEAAGAALALFAVQLALNAAWSWIFFGLHRPGAAFIEIVILWIAILGTVLLFWRVHWLPGALLLPYLAWVAFAAALNWQLWRLNA
jgi:tryptophan-rich sensory protein